MPPAEQMKLCSDPGHTGPNPLPVTGFNKDRSRRTGLKPACRECMRRRGILETARVRDRVLDHYGRACACCGATEDLSIDHVNGGGRAHRIELFGYKRAGTGFYRWLIVQGFPDGYQVLCVSCNSSKQGGLACRLSHGNVNDGDTGRVMVWLGDRELIAIDALVIAGVAQSRADAVRWCVRAVTENYEGVISNAPAA
jgi:hypothetical protein